MTDQVDLYITNIEDQINNGEFNNEIPKKFASTSTDIDKLISIPRIKTRNTSEICFDCGVKLNDNEEICSACGMDYKIAELKKAHVSSITRGSYNTSSDAAAPIKVSGRGGFRLQKQLMYRTNEYSKIQFKDTKNQLINITQTYEDNVIPLDIVIQTADLYYKIQCLGEIKRADVRIGTMAAGLSKLCDKNKIPQDRGTLCKMFKIQHDDLSNGEKILDRLCADGKLDRNIFLSQDLLPERRTEGFLIKYFMKLKIPLPKDDSLIDYQSPVHDIKYFEFATTLIRFTNKYKIASSSVPGTKTAGVIFILSTRFKNLKITCADIQNACNISPSTFKRFNTAVVNVLNSDTVVKKRLVHLFKKFNIPLK